MLKRLSLMEIEKPAIAVFDAKPTTGTISHAHVARINWIGVLEK